MRVGFQLSERGLGRTATSQRDSICDLCRVEGSYREAAFRWSTIAFF